MRIFFGAVISVLFKTAIVLGLLVLAGLHIHSYIYKNRVIEPITANASEIIHVKGPINMNLVPSVRQLVRQVRDGKQEIVVLIDSPGGYLKQGNLMVRAIEAAKLYGIEVTCVVDGTAASMATIILSHCSNRYATFGSRIMWHSVAYSGHMSINQATLKTMMTSLRDLNRTHWADTRKWFYPWYFTEHFLAETMLQASEVEAASFGFLRVIQPITIVPDLKSKLDKKQEKKVKEEKAKGLYPFTPKKGNLVPMKRRSRDKEV